MRCPVCKAENATPGACRRCKADLSMLWALEAKRRGLMARAASSLRLGENVRAYALARRAERVKSDEASRRLVAVCALVAGDPAAAWRAYSR